MVPRYVEPSLDYGFFVDLHPSVPMQGLLKWGRARESGKREAVGLPKINPVLWPAAATTRRRRRRTSTASSAASSPTASAKRSAGLPIARRKLDGLVSNDIKKMGFVQVPQLEGSKVFLDKKMFT